MVFVLTQREGKSSIPVGVCTNQRDANIWAAQAKGNDCFGFEVDQLEHLDFASNGPQYRPAPAPVFEIPLPAAPPMDLSDPLGSLKSISRYMHALTNTMESMQHALRG